MTEPERLQGDLTVGESRAARKASNRRRRGDKWRDLWLLIVSGFVALSIAVGYGHINDVQTQRRQSSSLTCNITSAISAAGRKEILSAGIPLTPKLERELKALGYPSLAVRQQAAQIAANQYANSISAAAAHAIGGHAAKGIVSKTGTLNCRRLAQFITR